MPAYPSREWEDADDLGPGYRRLVKRNIETRQVTSSDVQDKAAAAEGEATKEDLYQRAQELDIEGRSKMSRDELVEAIRHIEGHQRV